MKTIRLLALCVFALAAALRAQEITWQPLHEPGSGGRIAALGVSPHDSNHVIVTGDMLGVGVSFDRGDSWQPGFGLPSYECAEVTFHPSDPDTVWLGAMSGPCVSYDGGRNWEWKRNGFPETSDGHYTVPINQILMNPQDENHLLALSGNHRKWNDQDNSDWGSVWESFDAGESWTRKSQIKSGTIAKYGVLSAWASPDQWDVIYVALDGEGIYASYDQGATWEYKFADQSNTNVFWVDGDPRDPDVIYVALDNHKVNGDWQPGGILKSEDGGASWRTINDGLPQETVPGNPGSTSRYDVVRVSPTEPDRLFTSNAGWWAAGLYFSDDGGETWTETADPAPPRAYSSSGRSMETAAFDPNNADTVFAAGAAYVLRTVDGGASWDDATAYRPDPGAAPDAWRGRGYSGLVARHYAFHPSDPDVSAFSAMDAGNFCVSTDDLQTWTKGGGDLPAHGGGDGIAFTGSSKVFVALGQGGDFDGIGRSTDLGLTWEVLSGSGLPALGDGIGRATDMDAFPDRPNHVWAVIGGALFYSSDSGDSWRELDASGVNEVALLDSADLSYYVATDAGVLKGVGTSLSNHLSTDFPVTFCTVHEAAPDTLYLASYKEWNDGGIHKYENGSLTRVLDDKFVRHISIKPDDPSVLLAATADQPFHDETFAKGVYLSTDGGQSWSLETSSCTTPPARDRPATCASNSAARCSAPSPTSPSLDPGTPSTRSRFPTSPSPAAPTKSHGRMAPNGAMTGEFRYVLTISESPSAIRLRCSGHGRKARRTTHDRHSATGPDFRRSLDQGIKNAPGIP